MILRFFKVSNYRNVQNSDWIDVGDVTAFVGQNEAGKSNLFEALYRINPFIPNEAYDIDEDWPVDDWGNKDPSALVCEAIFSLTPDEIESIYDEARLTESDAEGEDEG
nr:AAA family ATPase [Anaerolineae bacterium]